MKRKRESRPGTVGAMPLHVRRAVAAQPFGPWERREAHSVPLDRGPLNANEEWCATSFVNNRYIVQMSRVLGTLVGEVIHLWINRIDGEMPRSWADLQRIKDELIGPERTAVQVFPPRSEIVDSANMAHLWVYPPSFVMPFTLKAAP